MNNLSRHIKSVAASVLAVAVTAVSPAFMHAKAADAGVDAAAVTRARVTRAMHAGTSGGESLRRAQRD